MNSFLSDSKVWSRRDFAKVSAAATLGLVFSRLALEGLAVTRAVHDRYHASRRNPWNEVECGDHYARSMASNGVYLAACGFEYHGPKDHIGFAPKISPENFKCAFTGTEGWGTYSQKAESGGLQCEIAVRYGKLKLKTIALENANASSVHTRLASKSIPAELRRDDKRILLSLSVPVEILSGEKLDISVS